MKWLVLLVWNFKQAATERPFHVQAYTRFVDKFECMLTLDYTLHLILHLLIWYCPMNRWRVERVESRFWDVAWRFGRVSRCRSTQPTLRGQFIKLCNAWPKAERIFIHLTSFVTPIFPGSSRDPSCLQIFIHPLNLNAIIAKRYSPMKFASHSLFMDAFIHWSSIKTIRD